MLDVFQRLQVTSHLLGGTLVSWLLRRTFREPGPYLYTVQVAPYATAEEWTNLNTVPLVDVTGAIVTDSEQRIFATFPNIYYRVRLDTAAGTHFSMAQQAVGNPSRRDWLLIRKIARNIRIGLIKGGGTPGKLYKRRMFGTLCPGYTNQQGKNVPCLDYDLQTPMNGNCPSCYGVGIRCGFYDPVDMPLDLTQTSMDRKVEETSTRGTVEDQRIVGTGLAWPIAEFGDVWRREDNDARYLVHQVRNTEELRGIPVRHAIALHAIPVTSVLHRLPAVGTVCQDTYYEEYGDYGYGGYASV